MMRRQNIVLSPGRGPGRRGSHPRVIRTRVRNTRFRRINCRFSWTPGIYHLSCWRWKFLILKAG